MKTNVDLSEKVLIPLTSECHDTYEVTAEVTFNVHASLVKSGTIGTSLVVSFCHLGSIFIILRLVLIIFTNY